MTMDEVFEESLDDGFAGNLDGEGYQARIVYGAKMSRDNETGEIEIFNTSRGGEMYLPISDYEKENFLEKLEGKSYEVIYHVASLPGDTGNPEEMVKVNILGLTNMLEFANMRAPSKLISSYQCKSGLGKG